MRPRVTPYGLARITFVIFIGFNIFEGKKTEFRMAGTVFLKYFKLKR